MPQDSNDGRLGTLLRLTVAVGLTAYVLWLSDPARVLSTVAGANLAPLAIAVLLVLADRTLMAYRWLGLLASLDPTTRPPFGVVMRIFFISTFVGTFLPASVGGEAFRAYTLAQQRVAGADAVASVFMDRMMGVLSVLLMGAVGLVLAQDLARDPLVLAGLALTTAACLGVVLLVFNRTVAVWARGLCARLPFARLQRTGAGLVDAIQRYAAHHRPLTLVLLSSLGVQVVRILMAYFIGDALHIDAPLRAYFALMPLIVLVMLLPVTMSGIGTSQAAFVWFFGRVGVPGAEAFALSVLFVGLSILGNIPGGILYALGGIPSVEEPDEPARR